MSSMSPRRPFAAALVALPLLAGLVVSARTAAAQPAEPVKAAPVAPAAEIVPPRPLAPLHADYPEGGRGDADVVLVITVNADGSVRAARVADGAEPFSTAALAASSGWRFEPATRGGKPFAASIKAAIHFTAPPPPAADSVSPDSMSAKPPPPGGAGAPGAAPAPPPREVLEVSVRGEVPSPGVTSVTRAEVRLLPGAFGDPFRAVETLPGVTPLASGVPFFYVRGAPPGNVGYYLDGIRVPLLYHIGLGPSVVHPAVVDRVDLYPGGYPARFGRWAGGVVSGELKEGATALHGEANLRLIDAGLMIEGPLPGDRGSFLAAGRYSFTAALLSAVNSTVDLGYWDYQARAVYHLTPRDDIAFFAFGDHDFLGDKSDKKKGEQTLFDTTFHRVDLRYERRLGGAEDRESREDRLRQSFTFGFDRTSFDRGSFVADRSFSSRTQLTRRASPTVLVRAGLDMQLDAYQADLDRTFPDAPGFTSLFSNRIDVAMGAHADVVIQVTPRLEVTPGLRFDFFETRGQSEIAIDPRLTARLAITKEVRLLQAHGLASQPPSFILPGPGFTRDLTGGLQRTFQTSVGVEADLPFDISGTLTFFRDAFFNLSDALGTSAVPNGSDGFPASFDRRVLGSSVGMELTLRRRLTRRLGGFISYTLSRSERVLPLSRRAASSFDRTHVLNIAGSYDLGRGFKAGTRMLLYSGYPINRVIPEAGRLPPFFRFDARVEKRWSVASGRGWLSLVLEAQNAFAAKEMLIPPDQCGTGKDCRIGPIVIPSIGIEGGF